MTANDLAIDLSDQQYVPARDWRDDSVCRKQPTQWWFAGGHHDTLLAKSICSGCVVRAQCLEFALSRPDLLGIWAATTPNERAAIRRGDRVPVTAVETGGVTGALLDVDNGVDVERGTDGGVDIDLIAEAEAEAEDEPAAEPKGNSRRGPRRGIGREAAASEHTDLLTPAEAARKLGVTPNTVTRWSRAGKISAIQTLGGHRRFRTSEIERVQREANLFTAMPFSA
jgi:excisionase family DNA binding protein